jgi:hypothetical protein
VLLPPGTGGVPYRAYEAHEICDSMKEARPRQSSFKPSCTRRGFLKGKLEPNRFIMALEVRHFVDE